MATCSGRKGVDCSEDATERDDRCIFHSEIEGKDPARFLEALDGVRRTGEARWAGWVIPIDCDFRGMNFIGPAGFYGATFTQYAGFYRATFTRDANFRRATFTRDANFYGATFTQDAGFYGATFTRVAGFYGATFTQDAGFYGATFTQDADFSGATFTQDADFYGATFTQDANFRGATFTQDCYFFGVFRRSAQFDQAIFKGRATLQDCQLGERSSFDDADVARVHPPTMLAPRSWRRSSFDDADVARVTFRRCRLAGAAFAHAFNLSDATFDQCSWGRWDQAPPHERTPGWLNRILGPESVEAVVWEETEARYVMAGRVAVARAQQASFQEAETVYREVRRSLETHKHFREADRFATRQLEMRRLAHLAQGTDRVERLWGELRANVFCVEAWYQHFGGYGESLPRPVMWLGVFAVLLGPLLLASTGLTQLDNKDLSPSPFRIEDFMGTKHLDLIEYSARMLALFPDDARASQPLAARLAQLLLRIAGPFFALLFGLAVRRRLRR